MSSKGISLAMTSAAERLRSRGERCGSRVARSSRPARPRAPPERTTLTFSAWNLPSARHGPAGTRGRRRGSSAVRAVRAARRGRSCCAAPRRPSPGRCRRARSRFPRPRRLRVAIRVALGADPGDVHRVDDAVGSAEQHAHLGELGAQRRVAEAAVRVDFPDLALDQTRSLLVALRRPDQVAAVEALGQVEDVLAAFDDVQARPQLAEGLDEVTDAAALVLVGARLVDRAASPAASRSVPPPALRLFRRLRRSRRGVAGGSNAKASGSTDSRRASRPSDLDRLGELRAIRGERHEQPHALLDASTWRPRRGRRSTCPSRTKSRAAWRAATIDLGRANEKSKRIRKRRRAAGGTGTAGHGPTSRRDRSRRTPRSPAAAPRRGA